jgi:hypothetical protein
MQPTMFTILLVVTISTAGFAEPVVVSLTALGGVVPPHRTAVVTFPHDMADVDSMSIRFVGTLTEGLGIRWDQTEPEPLRRWPEFYMWVDGVLYGWHGLIPLSIPPGDADVSVPFAHYQGLSPDVLAGVTTTIGCDILINTLWSVLIWPTAEITSVDLELWYSPSIPIEANAWSAIRDLYR